MISIETALQFCIINIGLCLIPCAEMVITITQSTVQGWRAGIAFVAGICLASIVQVILMALGISAIIQTSEILFNTLKVVGVCYLFYLAWQSFTQPIITMRREAIYKVDWLTLFRKGIVINFSTPMTPLYLLLLIPPFIDADGGSITFQSLQLGLIVSASFFAVYTFYSITADKIGQKLLQSKRYQSYLQKCAGLTIAGFAIYLALAQQ